MTRRLTVIGGIDRPDASHGHADTQRGCQIIEFAGRSAVRSSGPVRSLSGAKYEAASIPVPSGSLPYPAHELLECGGLSEAAFDIFAINFIALFFFLVAVVPWLLVGLIVWLLFWN